MFDRNPRSDLEITAEVVRFLVKPGVFLGVRHVYFWMILEEVIEGCGATFRGSDNIEIWSWHSL